MSQPAVAAPDPATESVEDAMKRALELEPPANDGAEPIALVPTGTNGGNKSYGDAVSEPEPALRVEHPVATGSPAEPLVDAAPAGGAVALTAVPDAPTTNAAMAVAPVEGAAPARSAQAEWIEAAPAPPRNILRARAAPATATAQQTPQDINRVFDHLVEAADDVIGLIAYALYKQDKRDWMVSWRSRHSAEPTPDQVEAFVNGQMTSAQRERYRAGARQILDAYALVAVDAERALITRDAIAGRVETAAERVETSIARGRRWWRQIPSVVIGALLAVGLMVGLVAILVALDVDVAAYLSGEPAAVVTNGVP